MGGQDLSRSRTMPPFDRAQYDFLYSPYMKNMHLSCTILRYSELSVESYKIFLHIGPTCIWHPPLGDSIGISSKRPSRARQEAQLSLRDRATRACQLKSGKVLHKCRRLVFEKL